MKKLLTLLMCAFYFRTPGHFNGYEDILPSKQLLRNSILIGTQLGLSIGKAFSYF